MRTLRTTLLVMVGLAPAAAIAQAPPTTPPSGTGSAATPTPAPVGPGKRPSLGLKPGPADDSGGDKGRVGNGKGAGPAPAAGDKGAPAGGKGAPPASDGKPGPGRPQPPPIRPGAGGNAPPPIGAPPAGNPPAPPSLTDGLPAEAAVNVVCGKPLPSGKKFKWSLRNEVELKDVVTWASTFLCHPVIVPENLRKQKVTIYAPDEITAEEARRMFYATLNAMGLTIQPQGSKGREVFTVIESQNAHTSSVPFIGTEGQPPSNDAFVTKLIRLKNAGPDEMVTVLNRLKSKDGDVIPFPATLSLLITDSGENIRRMEEVIRQLDQQPMGGDKVWTVKLHNVAASEMASILEKIFPKPGGASGGAPGGGAPKSHVTLSTPGGTGPGGGGGEASMGLSVTQIVPEDRSNTLIIVANEKSYQYVLAIIRRLDQSGGPMDNSMDRVHVYSLANANAEDMSATLSGLGIGVSRGRAGATPGATGASAARPATPAGGTTGTTGGAGATLFEGAVQIAPDKPTNSLVIVASGRDYLVVRDLIRKLDIARRQVFIEATILEVSLDKSRKLGAAFHAGDTVFSGDQQSLLFGGSEPNTAVNSILFSPAALSGLAAGLRGPNIPGAAQILGLPPGTSIPEFGVFVQALQNNNDVNVVSMPHILTTDNEKATIQVGQNLPFPGSLGGFPGAGAAVPGAPGAAPGGFGLGFGTSVQRQDVSLKLDCTPHVNDSDMVRLELDAEISDVAAENFNGLGPATNKRTAKTVVVVRDQQAVVIGGLVKDRIAESVSKVPLLGDIPILGYLFKYTTKTLTKQNLLIILTPYVIKDPADLRRIFERKVRERKEFLERYSAFQDPNNYDPAIDYRRKRGLLEEINRTAVEAEIEASEIRAAETAMHGVRFEGPVDPNAPPPPPPRSRLPQPQPNVIFETVPPPPRPDQPPLPPAPPTAPPDVGGNE